MGLEQNYSLEIANCSKKAVGTVSLSRPMAKNITTFIIAAWSFLLFIIHGPSLIPLLGDTAVRIVVYSRLTAHQYFIIQQTRRGNYVLPRPTALTTH